MNRSRGVSAVELLVALPVLLFIGLGALQFALVFHARLALAHALTEAARAGSVDGAEPAAIEIGLARGLVPYLYGASDLSEYLANLVRARVHVQQGQIQGWLRLERLSPTAESFADWGQPARSATGEPIDGMVEIPNDNLPVRILQAVPSSGAVGLEGSERIGRASRQTLADANLLKLHLTYGVPASIPLAGRFAAWAVGASRGCAAGGRRYGALSLAPASGGPAALPPICLDPGTWRSGDHGGTARIPVTVSTTVRMQSPARRPAPQGAAGGAPGRDQSERERVSVPEFASTRSRSPGPIFPGSNG